MTITWRYTATTAVICGILGTIAYLTANSTFLSSVDTAHHFVLVDELTRYHTVRPQDAPRMGAMAAYPPGSHWIATLLTPLAGSGLVAMTWVAIAAICGQGRDEVHEWGTNPAYANLTA
jgi:hypothetical protein